MRWITILSLVLSVCLAASNASAGRIFGDIKLDGKPVPAGVKVQIAYVPPAAKGVEPAPVVADSTVTDKVGSYKLTVKEVGKCILTILYEKRAATLEVFSYKNATRYDLILEMKGDTLSLRRK